MAAVPIKAEPRLEALTSLRFFAALGVVFFHANYAFPGLFYEKIDGVASVTENMLFELNSMVEFFFVLSGFVLAYNYRKVGKVNKRDFYLKRFARIYPLQILTFLVAFFIYWHAVGELNQYMINGALLSVFLLQSWVPGLHYNLVYNAPSWSLSDEVFFYLVFPFILTMKRSIVLAVIIVSFILLVAETYNPATGLSWAVHMDMKFPAVFYFFPPFRIAEFAVGIFLGLVFNHERKLLPKALTTMLEVILVGLLVVQIYHAHNFPAFIRTMYYLPIYAAIVYVFAHEQGYLSRGLANSKLLVLMGEASFSLYMWHHIAMHQAADWMSESWGWLRFGLFLVIVMLISIVSYKYFEVPARRLILNWRKKKLAAQAA